MNESAPALEVNGICRNFGGVVALRDVSFTVGTGEVVGLIGPNGAGKSTLFEIVSGNLTPTAGRISYFGTDCTAMPTYLRRRGGMCRTFQKVRLFESMTVSQNITVAASQCLPKGRDLGEEVRAVQAAGAGTSAQNVSAALAGLTPGTTYHFRVVASNASGTTNGTNAPESTPPVTPCPALTALRTSSTGSTALASLPTPLSAACAASAMAGAVLRPKGSSTVARGLMRS